MENEQNSSMFKVGDRVWINPGNWGDLMTVIYRGTVVNINPYKDTTIVFAQDDDGRMTWIGYASDFTLIEDEEQEDNDTRTICTGVREVTSAQEVTDSGSRTLREEKC